MQSRAVAVINNLVSLAAPPPMNPFRHHLSTAAKVTVCKLKQARQSILCDHYRLQVSYWQGPMATAFWQYQVSFLLNFVGIWGGRRSCVLDCPLSQLQKLSRHNRNAHRSPTERVSALPLQILGDIDTALNSGGTDSSLANSLQVASPVSKIMGAQIQSVHGLCLSDQREVLSGYLICCRMS